MKKYMNFNQKLNVIPEKLFSPLKIMKKKIPYYKISPLSSSKNRSSEKNANIVGVSSILKDYNKKSKANTKFRNFPSDRKDQINILGSLSNRVKSKLEFSIDLHDKPSYKSSNIAHYLSHRAPITMDQVNETIPDSYIISLKSEELKKNDTFSSMKTVLDTIKEIRQIHQKSKFKQF